MTIIDADIHPVPDPARVAERLPEPWRRRYLSGKCRLRIYDVTVEGDQVILMV